MPARQAGSISPPGLFKQAVNLSKQARAIEATLDGITPFNAGKKKEEALSLLKKWFPQMENFSGQLKKYKVTINDLLAENEKLEARAKASERGKMKERWNGQSWKANCKDIQRLVDRIPPEVLAELKRQQQHTKERCIMERKGDFIRYQIQKRNRSRDFSGKGNHAGKSLPGVHAGAGSGKTPGAGAAAL